MASPDTTMKSARRSVRPWMKYSLPIGLGLYVLTMPIVNVIADRGGALPKAVEHVFVAVWAFDLFLGPLLLAVAFGVIVWRRFRYASRLRTTLTHP